METSKHIDRERRRSKARSKGSWMKVLVRPSTIKLLMAIGQLITRVVWLILVVMKYLRE